MDDIPYEKFPLVNIKNVGKFDVTKILIDNGNSYDIIYSDMFEIMNLERGSLYPDEGSYL